MEMMQWYHTIQFDTIQYDNVEGTKFCKISFTFWYHRHVVILLLTSTLDLFDHIKKKEKKTLKMDVLKEHGCCSPALWIRDIF